MRLLDGTAPRDRSRAMASVVPDDLFDYRCVPARRQPGTAYRLMNDGTRPRGSNGDDSPYPFRDASIGPGSRHDRGLDAALSEQSVCVVGVALLGLRRRWRRRWRL